MKFLTKLKQTATVTFSLLRKISLEGGIVTAKSDTEWTVQLLQTVTQNDFRGCCETWKTFDILRKLHRDIFFY